jgi:hypothetical protein
MTARFRAEEYATTESDEGEGVDFGCQGWAGRAGLLRAGGRKFSQPARVGGNPDLTGTSGRGSAPDLNRSDLT